MIVALFFLSSYGVLMLWRMLKILYMYVMVWRFERHINKTFEALAQPKTNKKIKFNPIPLHTVATATMVVIVYWMSLLVLAKEAFA